MRVKQLFEIPKTSRGQGGIVGLIVAIILIVAVAIPITLSVIVTANVTGTTAIILNLLPVFLALGGLVLVAGVAQRR